MDWTHVLGIILGNCAFIIPLFIWNRSESRSDIRHMDVKLEANRNLVHAIHLEMKDFHSKLYQLEKERKP